VTPTTPASQSRIGAIGPAVVPLLAIAVFINYVDRGNLATAAPLIKDQLHFSSTQIGVLLSAFRLSDRWIRRGASDNRVRKAVIVSGYAILATSLVAAAVGNLRVSVISLFCAGVAFGLNTPTLLAIAQTLAGPQVAGRWTGIQNCVGNLAGIVAPIITGFVVDRSGQYYWAFIIAAAVVTVGIVAWGLVIGTVAPLNWGAETHGRDAMAVDTA